MNRNKISLQFEDIGNFLANFAERSDHVYWISSPDMKSIRYISPSFEKIWKQKREDLYKNPELWISYLHPDDARDHHPINVMSEKIKILGKKARYSENYRIVRPDGEVRWITDNGFPIYDDKGNCYGVAGIAIDISAQKHQLEELEKAKLLAEAADKAKSVFIANMSHDIRTPLTGIIGLSSIIEEEAGDEKIKEYAHMLNISGEQLLTLLNSVLELVSKDNLQKNMFTGSVINLPELLKDIHEIELPSLTLKSIQFETSISENVPRRIFTDREKLYRILLNIVSNAIKFTHHGSISIHVDLEEKKSEPSLLTFKIQDTGIGIAKEDIQKVFEPFFRATLSQEGKYDGYGIGLHIVQEYMKCLHGKIAIDSEPGIGTCIQLTIPLNKSAAEQNEFEVNNMANDRNPLISVPVEESNRSDLHFLIIEDNIIARKVITSLLDKKNIRYQEAGRCQEGFELFQQHHFDAIITDIGLPDGTGYDIAEQLSSLYKSSCPPIFGLSAHARQQVEIKGQRAGMTGMLEKPLNAEKLNTIIAHLNKQEAVSADKHPPMENQSNTHQKLLDETLALSYLGTRENLKEMLELMLSISLVEARTDIKEHLKNKNWSELKKAAHKFKSSCMYCATTALLEHTKTLETLAETEDAEALKKAYESFTRCAQETQKHVEQWLGKPS